MSRRSDTIKVAANVKKLGLRLETWDATVTGEQVKKKKPSPDIFLFAARELHMEPEVCTVVEDAVNGIQAAKAAKMRSVAVATTFPAERLQAADVVCKDISQVQLSDLAPK